MGVKQHETGHVLGLGDPYHLQQRPWYLRWFMSPKRIDDPLFSHDIMQNLNYGPQPATIFSLIDLYKKAIDERDKKKQD